MRQLLRNRFFWWGVLLRVALMPFFGSQYLREMFIPFIDSAILHLGQNPWALSPAHFFPYGSFLFGLLFIPKFLAVKLLGLMSLGDTPISLIAMKIPLLGMDVLFLWAMMRICGERRRSLFLLYWFNPVTIFITYVHGQLDVVVMALCFFSLILLTYRKIEASAVLMACATLSKFHVVILVPFILAYLWHQNFAKKALSCIGSWLLIWGTLSYLGFLPVYHAGRFFYASTTSPEAMRIFSANLNFGSGQVIYLGVFVVLAVLGRLCVSSRITDRGLIFGSCSLFGALLIGTSSMPGWYYWVIPFFCLFFALYLNVSQILFWGFQIIYILNYVLLPKYGAALGNVMPGVVFTLLQTSMAGILIIIWKLVLNEEAKLQGRARPLMLGIAGNSGAGKNHLSHIFQDLFNPQNTVIVEGDDYHKWERNHQKWQEYTHLNPRANHLSTMASHALQLAKGTAVLQSHYDHASGKFTEAKEIKPTKTLIIQGLHTLYLRGLRSKFDLKIFIDPHEVVRFAWKYQRDVKERGHSPEKVVDSFMKREEDSLKHISPQKEFADWVIQYLPDREVTRDEVMAGTSIDCRVRYTFWNDAPIGLLLKALQELARCQISFEVSPNDINRTLVEIQGNPTQEEVQAVAKNIFPNLRSITRAWKSPTWRSGVDGLNQLTALTLLSGTGTEEFAI
jgi:uridine kinase